MPDAPIAPRVALDAGLARGELPFQRCEDCGAAAFHPRVLCAACGGTRLAWCRSAGLGTVYATTTVHVRGRDPHNVVLVDLDEGFRMMSRLDGVAPERVRIGARVRARVVTADRAPLVVFQPEAAH